MARSFHCLRSCRGVISVSYQKSTPSINSLCQSGYVRKRQENIFDHLGHEKAINEHNYQCPAGIGEIRVMGSFLSSLEGKINACTYKANI